MGKFFDRVMLGLLWSPTVILPFAIIISLCFRLYVFLKDGHNPTIRIDIFFPQSGAEYSWKGVEMMYDYVASSPIEVVLLIGFVGLVWVTQKITDQG